MGNNTVIIGAGIAGLVSALLISQDRTKKVSIIEKNSKIGGLLGSSYYKEAGFYDYGAHNFLETGIEEFDNLLLSMLPEGGWKKLEGYEREIAGCIYNNKVQLNSPFPDLRSRPDYPELVIDFFKTSTDIYGDSLYSYMSNRYGVKITEVLRKPIESIYGETLERLHKLTSSLIPLSRIVLFDKHVMDNLNKVDFYRSKLAYPDQRSLNLKYSSGKSAYYPKGYGMYRFVDAIKKELLARGVEIYTDVYPVGMKFKNNCVSEIKLSNGAEIDSIESAVWSVGGLSLLSLMGISVAYPKIKKGNTKTFVLNLLLSEKLNVDDLYYIYDLSGSEEISFRVSAPYNYCQNAPRGNGYPVTVELLSENEKLDGIENRVLNKLRENGIIAKSTNVLFSSLEPLNGGFVTPTIDAINFYEKIREIISKSNISNLINVGVMSEKDLFFQTDILIDVYRKVRLNNV